MKFTASEIIAETMEILAENIKGVAEELEHDTNMTEFLKNLRACQRLMVVAMGRSGLVARFSKNWLSKIIKDVRVIEMGDEDVPSDFGQKESDFLMAISSSGRTAQVIDYTTTLRKEKGIKIVAITTKPEAPAWHERDLIIHVKGRTKEDWIKERGEKIGQRVPLGTLSEFTSLVFLSSAVQTIMEKRFDPGRLKEIMLQLSKELIAFIPSIRQQNEELERTIDVILAAKRNGGRVVLDGMGRVRRILEIFATRLIEVYGINPLIIRSFISAKIREKKDAVLIASLSGEVIQTFKTVSHCVEEKGIVPIYFTCFGESPANELISKGEVLGIKIGGKVQRRGGPISWSKMQFLEGGKTKPLDSSAEFLLLGLLEGIFACIMEKLGLTEKDLEHAELE